MRARKGAHADSRVAHVRTFHLSCQLPEALGSAQSRIDHRHALLVQVVSESGVEGWGECAGPPAITQAAIQTYYGRHFIGRDALQIENLWNEAWRASQPWARRGVMLGALSGLDMALWDLRGKLLGRSLSEMMGGRLREQVPCYATGLFFRDRPETSLIPLLVEEAHVYVEAGYRAVKAQIGRNLSFDTALIRALRQALPTTPLLADACNAYDLPEAVIIGKTLEETNFLWLEDPLSAERPDQIRQLSDRVRVPIAMGESEQTRWGFQSLLSAGGVSMATPDLSYCGGPSEAMQIRAVAAGLGINVTPHSGGTMLNLAAALHFLASDFRYPGRLEPAMGFLGRNGTPNPLRDAIFSRAIEIDSGLARVPIGPGLGVNVDVEEMRSFCVSEQEVKSGT